MSKPVKVSFLVAPWFNRAMPHNGVAYLRSFLEARGHITEYHDLSALHYRDPFLRPIRLRLLSNSSLGACLFSSLDALFEGFFGEGLASRLGATLHKILLEWADRCAQSVLDTAPDIVALSVYDSNLVLSLELARALKRREPSLTIVLGGPCLVDPNLVRILGELGSFLDYIVMGEGEEPLAELIDVLTGNRSALPVSCVSSRSNWRLSEAIFTLVSDLDALPFPTYEGVPFSVYSANLHAELSFVSSAAAVSERILPISFGRGCPYRCSFCGHNAWWSNYRLRSVDSVVTEMQSLLRRYDCRVFRVNDSLMNMNREWLLALCEAIESLGGGVFWYGHVRASGMDRELAERLFSAGCRYVKFGLESGSDRVLKLMNKRTTVRENSEAVRAAHKAGLKTRSSFMVNFPGESEDDLEETIAFVKNHREYLDGIRVFDTTLVPASEVALHPEEYGVEISWHSPQTSNLEVIDAASSIPRGWSCRGLPKREAARRLKYCRDELGDIVSDHSRTRIPPTFPELLENALDGNPILIADREFARKVQRGQGTHLPSGIPGDSLDDEILDSLKSGPKSLQDLYADTASSQHHLRSRLFLLLAWGSFRVLRA